MEAPVADEPKRNREDRPRRATELGVLRIEGGKGKREKRNERVVSEHTLVISTPSGTIARLQYLPGQENELAAGFLVTSGLASPSTLDLEIRTLDSRTTEAKLCVEIDPAELAAFRKRLSLAASGALSECPVGRDLWSSGRHGDAAQADGDADTSLRIEAAAIFEAMKCFRNRSELFKATGAVHGAAIVDARGEEFAFADDIGRHNALDKVVGECVLREIPLADKLLLTSGRLSVEMVSKCVRAGLPVVISPGAPTDAAVEIAGAAKLTLVGFARDDRMNVYTAEWKIA